MTNRSDRRSGARRAKAGPRQPSPSPTSPATSPAQRWLPGLGIFAWTLAVHGVVLAGSVLKSTPVSPFFFGDSLTFVEEARRLAQGLEALPPGLPYHPPLTTWLLVPVWWVLGELPAVSLAAKLLMAALSGLTWALFFSLLQQHWPGERRAEALLICLLAPLSFGELALNAAVSTEVPYRLLLLALVGLAWRRPFLAGLLHGLASLTRAEHLPVALAAGAAALLLPGRRREVAAYLLRAASGLALVVLPYGVWAGGELAAYNRLHAAELPEPLPVVVPVSIYGPLNFALAQREEEIFFSRRTLPPPPGGGLAALDPTFPPHHRALVHGYRLGWEEIFQRPGRFAERTAAKLGHSLRALACGWTWRELPRGSAAWVRQPVDIAHGSGATYTAFALLLAGLGAWALRRQRAFLAIGGALLAYRLGINALFFPYLRGILVVAPFTLVLFWAGWRVLLPRDRWRKVLLAALLALLAGFHFLTAAGEHRYRLAGERSEDGAILDDRRVEIELVRP